MSSFYFDFGTVGLFLLRVRRFFDPALDVGSDLADFLRCAELDSQVGFDARAQGVEGLVRRGVLDDNQRLTRDLGGDGGECHAECVRVTEPHFDEIDVGEELCCEFERRTVFSHDCIDIGDVAEGAERVRGVFS